MGKYKSFAKQGSFSEYQLNVPDQTQKIKNAAAKKIKGMDTAQQFLEKSQRVYQEAQELSQQRETETREDNFQRLNEERENFKQALRRDYDTEIRNIDNQFRGKQNEYKAIAEFSQTAFKLAVDFKNQRDEAQRMAAHDVYLRTGATFQDALALQKLNDNLTRQEFAASKVVQDMLGSGQDPAMIDGLFQIYQNRNSKIWIESKAGLINSVNNFPIFADQKLQKILEDNGGTIPDIEGALAQIQRDFIEINYSKDKIRPEVLSEAGVYKSIRDTTNTLRTRLLANKRENNKAELKLSYQTAFADLIRTDGIVAAVRQNSVNPTKMQREAMFEAMVNGLNSTGDAHIPSGDILRALDMEGGGPNGQSLRQAYAGTPELAKVDQALRQHRRQNYNDWVLGENIRKLHVEDTLRNEYDAYIERNGNFTEENYRELENRAVELGGAGYSSKFLTSIKNTTDSAQFMEESMKRGYQMANMGDLTTEHVLTKMRFTADSTGQQNRQKFLNLAAAQERLAKSTPVGEEIDLLRAAVIKSHPMVVQKYADGKKNLYSVGRAQDAIENKFKTILAQIYESNPGVLEEAAIAKASEVAEKEIEKLAKTVDKNGVFTDFGIPLAELAVVERARTASLRIEKEIRNLKDKYTFDNADLAGQLIEVLGEKSLRKQIMMLNEGSFKNPPPSINYAARQYNVNPLDIYKLVAPKIGEPLNLVEDVTSYFKPKYNYTRNAFPHISERIGRANIGDQGTGLNAPIRPSMFEVVQYVSGDPAIANTADGGRIVYDPRGGTRGHGGDNYHNHYEFATQEQAYKAIELFKAAGFKVTSHWRRHDTGSAHSRGVAVDVAPPVTLPRNPEAEAAWSARANAVIGFDPNE